MIVDSAVYRDGKRLDRPDDLESTLQAVQSDSEAFCWIGLHEPTEREMARVTDAFDLHPLAVEDALEPHQRPKVEAYDNMVLVVLKYLTYLPATSALQVGEIRILVGPNYVVTVRYGKGQGLGDVRERLERRASVLDLGSSGICYAICDEVVDDYIDVATELEIDVEDIEQSVFSTDRTSDAQAIFALKRQVLTMRRAVSPLIPPLERLETGSVPGIDPATKPFFRDVADHANRVADQVEALDDLLTSILQAHLARINVQQNEDMRRISAWVAIFAVPTMIAGIYGMNFRHMPELHTTFGYPIVLLVMLVSCVLLHRLFKKAGWL